MQLPLFSIMDVIQICHMALVGSSSFLLSSIDRLLNIFPSFQGIAVAVGSFFSCDLSAEHNGFGLGLALMMYSSHFFLYCERLLASLQGQGKVSAAHGESLLKPVQGTPMPDEQVFSTASVSLKRPSTRKRSRNKSKVSATKETPARSSHVKVKREPKSSVKPKARLPLKKKKTTTPKVRVGCFRFSVKGTPE